MISSKLKILVLTLLLAAVSADFASAQDSPPPDAQRQQLDAPQNGKRPNLFRELGLTREQMQQIRRINMARKPQMEEATRRLREANRNLDTAIYSDTVDETDVQTRLKEFQLAQAEVAKLRFISELAVRKILSAEQLVKFRELRRKFAEAVRPDVPPPGNENDRQVRQFIKRQNQPRPN